MQASTPKNPLFQNKEIPDNIRKIFEYAIKAGNGETIDGSIPKLDSASISPNLDGTEIRSLIESALMTPKPDISLIILKISGFLQFYLPEVDRLASFTEDNGEHKNLWEHTIMVVAQTPQKAFLRWAALLHDIGKPRTKKRSDNGEIHFIGHEKIGAKMTEKILRRLNFPEKEAKQIVFLVLNHLRCSQYDSLWTDSAVRRLYKELGENFENLLEISRADITTKRSKKREKYLKLIDELHSRALKIKEEDSKPPLLPSGLGNRIMEIFSIPEGPKIGKIRSSLEKLIEQGKLEAGREPDYYIEYLNSNPDIIK